MRAVIFDLDGVLVDSEPCWQRGFAMVANDLADEWGLAGRVTPDEMVQFQGGRVNDTMHSVMTSLGAEADRLDHDLASITDRVVASVSDAFVSSPSPIPTSVNVARGLADHGVRMAVCSSSGQKFIDTAVTAVGLADAFEVKQSALHLSAGKPDPEVYRVTLGRLGVPATQACAVEDSSRGLVSALAAGLPTVWLQREPELSDDQARDRLAGALATEGLDDSAYFRNLVTITPELDLASMLDLVNTEAGS